MTFRLTDPASAHPGRRHAAIPPRLLLLPLFILIALLLLLPFLLGDSQHSAETQPRSPIPATAPATTQRAALDDSPHVTRDEQGRLQWPRPRTDERQDERDEMVATQIASGGLFRDAIEDPRVLAALRAVPRHWFVPDARLRQAYADSPLPIGYGQTISQPYIVALMTALLHVQPGDRILEIGTGSGYQAAVLSELTPHVYTIEIVAPLEQAAAQRLDQRGYATIRVRPGDGYDGWAQRAPFDGIIVTCAAGHVPPPLWDQLKPGGRMVIPVGGVYETQRLLVLTKQPDGGRQSRNVLPVRFVPMTGKSQRP